MTFRSDHEAALARAEALEAEAKQRRYETERAKAELERVEVERDRLRAEVARLRAAPPTARTPARARTSETVSHASTSLGPAAIGIPLFIGLILIILFAAHCGDKEPAIAPEPRTMRECVVRSEPTGAAVMVVQTVTTGRLRQPGIAVPIGSTPLSKPAFEWGLYMTNELMGTRLTPDDREPRMELRLAGYAPMPIDDPCADTIYRLVPLPQAPSANPASVPIGWGTGHTHLPRELSGPKPSFAAWCVGCKVATRVKKLPSPYIAVQTATREGELVPMLLIRVKRGWYARILGEVGEDTWPHGEPRIDQTMTIDSIEQRDVIAGGPKELVVVTTFESAIADVPRWREVWVFTVRDGVPWSINPIEDMDPASLVDP
ncbi:MAG TPA: hypothetical protein VIV11_02010 [Kofleriaceae bacterium]